MQEKTIEQCQKSFVRTRQGVIKDMTNTAHLVWTTGGGMVTEPVIQEYFKKEAASPATS